MPPNARGVRTRHVLYMVLHLFLFIGGVLLVQVSSVAAQAVGASLAAAGIAGGVVFVYALEAEKVLDRLEILDRFGLVKAFAVRSVRIRDEYEVHLNHLSQRIDIMGFGLRAFLEDYRAQFAAWAKKATVRVLLVDPEFPVAAVSYATQRDVEEGNDVGSIDKDVRHFVRTTANIAAGAGNRLQIRLYRCLPAVNVFRIDGHLFWGPYLMGEQSRNMPTFLAAEGGVLFTRLSEHFERIWSDERLSRPVPKEWTSAA